jgi:hypothetical protein
VVSLGQSILAVTAAVIGSALFQAGLDRIWPSEERRPYNDLIGWQLGVLGTTYAVILGFMLFAVWTALREADLNADLEANAVLDMYRLAQGLPEPQRTRLQTLARSYVDAVITEDWPQMARGEVPERTRAISAELWDTVMSVREGSATEITAQEQVQVQLSSVDQHRLTRVLQSTRSLPPILWSVLLTGGALTIISACMFGGANRMIHTGRVISFSLVVSLCLVAIADIHRPFHGLIHVQNYAFQRAWQSMQAR